MTKSATEEHHVLGEVKDGIATLTFSNPDRHNALPQAGWEAVPRVVSRLCAGGARVLIVRGEGSVFCAGADISEFDRVRRDAQTARVYEKTNIDAFAALREAPVPVIARISGFCLGGGFGLAAACDIRVADETARFAVPAARLGLAYPVEAMADIVHAVGTQNAKLLLYAARRYDAHSMQAMGFLAQVTERGALDNVVSALAADIADLAPLTHSATKAAVHAALGGDAKEATDRGARTFLSQDYAEGRQAFKQKRQPRFMGC